jgi:serine/threonine-protein kinase
VDLEPGVRLGRYVIDGLIGRGGMGAVHRATDTELGRAVAIKVISGAADEAMVARFKREARVACAFSHPNAATVFDVGTFEGRPFLVMELCQGDTLRVAADGKTSDDKVRWLVEIAEALGAAHRAGLVHRDVQPDNVIVTSGGTAKLIDFGIAREVAGGVDASAPTARVSTTVLTATGAVVGSPAYMSPEQLRGGAIDGRSDQFSWGVTAYEVLTGRLPWAGGSAYEIAASILGDDPPPLASVSPGVDGAVARAVMRCLSRDAADRFATMDEVVAAITSRAQGADAAPAATSAAATTARRDRAMGEGGRRAVPWIVVGAVGLVAGGGWALQRSLDRAAKEPPAPRTAPTETILGLNDPATRRQEEEASKSAWARACKDQGACAGDNRAWCDDRGQRVACCALGLAGTRTGRCGCPPGGTDVASLIDKGCKEAEGGYHRRVQEVIRGRRAALVGCYDAALARNAKLAAAGKLVLEFEIGPDGSAWDPRFGGVDVPDPEFQDCVIEVVGGAKFAPPANGWAGISYPISFSGD